MSTASSNSKPPFDWLFRNPRSGGLATLEAAALIVGGLLLSYAHLHLASNSPLIKTGSVTLQLIVAVFICHVVVTIRRRRWNAWFSLVGVVFLFFTSQLLAEGLIELYYHLVQSGQGTQLAGADFQALVTERLTDSVPVQFAYTALAEGLLLLGLYGNLRLFRIKISEIGLKRPRLMDPVYGLAAVVPYYVVYFVVVVGASSLIPSLNVSQSQDIGFKNVQGGWELVLTFVSLVVLPPIAEEILMRGFLYSSLKKALPIVWAAILTSLLFAAAHLPEGGAAGPLYIAALDTFVLSMFLVGLREVTGSLWAGITLHAIKNGIAFAALYLVHIH